MLNSGKEHVCCVAQKRILGYDRRGFPTGRSANWNFESGSGVTA